MQRMTPELAISTLRDLVMTRKAEAGIEALSIMRHEAEKAEAYLNRMGTTAVRIIIKRLDTAITAARNPVKAARPEPSADKLD